MKWAGIASALVFTFAFPLLSRRKAIRAGIAKLKPKGFPGSADRVHCRVSGRRWHGRQRAVLPSRSRLER